jgi:hypothetical protein
MRARWADTTTPSGAERVQRPLFHHERGDYVRPDATAVHRRPHASSRYDRGTRWGAAVAGAGALLAAFAVAALAGTVVKPPVTAPAPPAMALPPTVEGPTPNITKVANAITVRAKSLTTLVKVLPGLALTKPVTIIVDYASPVGKNRISQVYDATYGNRFLYNDPEGNRYPRQLTMSITLTEDRPGGQPYTFSFPARAMNLDPLFDVSITPLRFTLTSKCTRIGDSDIKFRWSSPEQKAQQKSFSTKKGKTVTINEFAWARQEVSASANLYWPDWVFSEDCIQFSGACLSGVPAPTIKLLPGWSGGVGRHLKADCQRGSEADIFFNMTIQIRKYDNL